MCGNSNITPAGFSLEQQAYIERLIAQLDLQAAFAPGSSPGSSPGIAPGSTPPAEPQPVTVFGTPYEDLCKEEVAKLDTHPCDLWPKLRDHAARRAMPEGTDVFMFKHHGMFNVAPAQAGYMCRLRIPACRLTGYQLAHLADLIESSAGGYAHVTTRGNLQFREIPPENLVHVLTSLCDLGLTSKGSGADSVRNITCSPTAGFDPLEVADLSPHAIALHHHILNTRDLQGIPRKFNVAFDCGGSVSCVSDTNDVGFLATEVSPNDKGVDPGVYCRVLVGGITGHKDFARDTGLVVRPGDTVDAAIAMIRVFIEHADRTNRKKARLKYVLDAHGLDWFMAQAQAKLEAMGSDARFIPLDPALCAPRAPIDRRAHIGVHPQRGAGLNYLGVALPVGRLLPDQMRGLADVAREFGRDDVRLTVWQNLLVPHVADENVPAAVAAIEALGLTVEASSFAAGAIACTGRFGCRFASSHTKEHAAMLVEHLQSRFELDTPINIHLTGCPNSCAQHYAGDIGLLGASTEDGREAYHVFLGGGCDHDQAIARHLCGPVAADELPSLLEMIVRTYLEARDARETFVQFTHRHTDAQLQKLMLASVVA